MSEICKAPWNEEQVEFIRYYQHSGNFHPYTCGNAEHNEAIPLHVTPNGMLCPTGCGYQQAWVHNFTVTQNSWETIEWL